MVEDAITTALKDAIGCRDVQQASPFSGSALNETRVYKTDKGRFFVKLNSADLLSMYEAEAKGLEALAQTATVRVPKPYYYGKSGDRAFLITENIAMRPHSNRSLELLGTQLAKMHLTQTSCEFGFPFDNTIGTTLQKNSWTKEWVQFFGLYRLGFQFEKLERYYGDKELRKQGGRLIEKLPEFFKGIAVRCSLLHGDLWSGNTAADSEDNPVVYDPAPYFGHDEAELGIMGMFGGFSLPFYEAYHDKIPKRDGFEDRQKIYQLYHYLNHYNIFGSDYRPSCVSIIKKLV